VEQVTESCHGLGDLLTTNPVTIGQAIRETRALMDEQRITASQTTHYFSRAQDLRDWLDHGAVTSQMQISQTLSHPDLTGMPRDEFQALIERVAVPYYATVERRRHRQRGGNRLPGSRRASSGRRSPMLTGSWPPCWPNGNSATSKPWATCSQSAAAPSATPSTTSCPCSSRTATSRHATRHFATAADLLAFATAAHGDETPR
jgi:hypothetical protein